jgi:peroxiredoxin Q/BCP
MTSSLGRRSLLQGFLLLPAALLGRAPSALALGGVLPELNTPAPDFDLPGVTPDREGKPIESRLNLAAFQGRWLVLYFYPRDFTSGCTLEARGFQRDLASFEARGASVVGVSADDAESHASFCGSEGLAYPLLSDPAGEVSRRYGSWMAPYSLRHTFLIDPEGTLRQRWTGVHPAQHSQELLAALNTLQAAKAS